MAVAGRRGPSACAAVVVLVLVALSACASGSAPPGSGTCDDPTATARVAGEPGDAPALLAIDDPAQRLVVYADGAVAVQGEEGTAEAGAAPGVTVPTTARTTADTLAPRTAASGPASRSAARAPRLAPGYPGAEPGLFVGGYLPGCWGEEVASRADALLEADLDPGFPQITDSLSTVFTYRPTDGGETVRVSAYAFTRGDQGDQGLTRGEQRVREALSGLWDVVEDHAVVDGPPLPPTELEVLRFGAVPDGEVDWPLPPPTELFGDADCVAVTGQDVDPLLDRLADGDLLASEPWRLAVRAQPPGLPACED